MIKKFNEFVNEGVRELMTPISGDMFSNMLDETFEKAGNDGEYEMEPDFFKDIWINAAEKYHTEDDYYLYKGKKYVINVNFDDDDYEESVVLTLCEE
jgi:hypothetical protein